MGWWGKGATAAQALQQAPSYRSGSCLVWHVPPGAYVDGNGLLRYDSEGPEPELVAQAQVGANRRGLVRVTEP